MLEIIFRGLLQFKIQGTTVEVGHKSGNCQPQRRLQWQEEGVYLFYKSDVHSDALQQKEPIHVRGERPPHSPSQGADQSHF